MNRTTDPAEFRLVDRSGLAAVLGVSPARVKELHDTGRIAGYLIGARLRYDVVEVLAALRNGPNRIVTTGRARRAGGAS